METAGFSKMNEGSVKWGMYDVMLTVVMQQEADGDWSQKRISLCRLAGSHSRISRIDRVNNRNLQTGTRIEP
jgi:hypothetical protein